MKFSWLPVSTPSRVVDYVAQAFLADKLQQQLVQAGVDYHPDPRPGTTSRMPVREVATRVHNMAGMVIAHPLSWGNP
jgi:hypothetical protein